MPSTGQEFLSRLISNENFPLDLVPEAGRIIAAHLESAVLDNSRESLERLSKELVDIFYSALSKASASTKAAVVNEGADDDARSSFVLGQLSIAQSLAGLFLEHRAGEDFNLAINETTNKDYFLALLSSDMTNTELAAVVSQRTETVSRKLRKFRELGVTEYRRDGVKVINFLSPVARARLEEVYSSVAVMPVVARERIAQETDGLEGYLSHFPAFGGKAGRAVARV